MPSPIALAWPWRLSWARERAGTVQAWAGMRSGVASRPDQPPVVATAGKHGAQMATLRTTRRCSTATSAALATVLLHHAELLGSVGKQGRPQPDSNRCSWLEGPLS